MAGKKKTYIMTAAHVIKRLQDQSNGPIFVRVRDNNGICTDFAIPKGLRVALYSSPSDSDVILFEAPRTCGSVWQVKALNMDESPGLRQNIVVYHVEPTSGMNVIWRRADGLSQRNIPNCRALHTATTPDAGGASGSPVMRISGQHISVYGVHTTGDKERKRNYFTVVPSLLRVTNTETLLKTLAMDETPNYNSCTQREQYEQYRNANHDPGFELPDGEDLEDIEFTMYAGDREYKFHRTRDEDLFEGKKYTSRPISYEDYPVDDDREQFSWEEHPDYANQFGGYGYDGMPSVFAQDELAQPANNSNPPKEEKKHVIPPTPPSSPAPVEQGLETGFAFLPQPPAEPVPEAESEKKVNTELVSNPNEDSLDFGKGTSTGCVPLSKSPTTESISSQETTQSLQTTISAANSPMEKKSSLLGSDTSVERKSGSRRRRRKRRNRRKTTLLPKTLSAGPPEPPQRSLTVSGTKQDDAPKVPSPRPGRPPLKRASEECRSTSPKHTPAPGNQVWASLSEPQRKLISTLISGLRKPESL